MNRKSSLFFLLALCLVGLILVNYHSEKGSDANCNKGSILGTLPSNQPSLGSLAAEPKQVGTLRKSKSEKYSHLVSDSRNSLLSFTPLTGVIPKYKTGQIDPDLIPKIPELTKPQRENLNRLRWGSSKSVRYVGEHENGTVKLLSSPELAAPLNENETPQETAARFFNDNNDLFLLNQPAEELELVEEETDSLGYTVLRYDQMYEGLEVWPSGLTVNVAKDGRLTVVTGAYVPTPAGVDLKPAVRADTASTTAYGHVGVFSPPAHGPELKIYSGKGITPELAYEVHVHGQGQDHTVFVSAISGDVLLGFSNLCGSHASGSGTDVFGDIRPLNLYADGSPTRYEARDTTKAMYNSSTGQGYIGIFDGTNYNQVPQPPLPIKFSYNLNSGHDSEAVSALFNLSAVYDFFLSQLGRNSFDNQGTSIRAAVRVPDSNGNPLFNAFWSGSTLMMGFGTGEKYTGASDVIGHEMTHGVVQFEAGLAYRSESGALNESFADIFGECFENYLYGTHDWLVGSFLTSALRSMSNPGSITWGGSNPYPDRMTDYYVLPETREGDWGGVHINSSIPNHAFYLLVTGLPGGGIGLGDARAIFYRALDTKLNPNSGFTDLRLACVTSAEELFGTGTIQVTKVEAAFDQVEIFEPMATPTNPGDLTPVSGADSYLFSYLAVDSNYYLGRREAAFGDGTSVTNISLNPMSLETKPSVTGDGSVAVFVTNSYDLAAAATNGGGDNVAGSAGYFNSAAISPDGTLIAAILRDPSTGLPDQAIYLEDSVSGESEVFDLYLPVIDGPSTFQLSSVDELDFTPSGQLLIFDGLAQASLEDGTIIEGWTIFAADLNSKEIYRLFGPISGLNIGNPASSSTGILRLTFEVDTGSNGDLYNWDLVTGTYDNFDTVTYDGYFAYPDYSAADDFVTYTEDYYNFGRFAYVPEVRKQALQSDKITATGFSSSLGSIYRTGTNYRRGTFSGAPSIMVTAVTPSVEGGNTGTFRIARTSGDQTIELPVSFKSIGTASPQQHYDPFDLEAVIPASATYVDVNVSVTLTPDDTPQTLVMNLDTQYHYKLIDGSTDATMNLIPPPMTYFYYASENNLGSATSDDDGDKLSNIFEYAIGSDATTYSSVQLETELPEIALDKFLQVTVKRSLDRPGITWSLERSTNLSQWDDASTAIVNSTDTEITLRDTLPLGDDPKRFIRVKVTED